MSVREKNSTVLVVAWMVVVVMSFYTAATLFFDSGAPEYYGGLFALPLVFGILSLVFANLYFDMSKNFGMALILMLLFCRMVLSPLFMRYGGYQATLARNIDKNTSNAILLVLYEAIAVFVTLFILNKKTSKETILISGNRTKKISKKYDFIVLVALVAFFVFYAITPQIKEIYRTIFQISDEFFTNYEDSRIVDKYATSFLTKFSLVTGTYLSRVLIPLLPAYLIVKLSYNSTQLKKGIARLLCFLPLFYISGAIASSLINSICLIILYNYVFEPDKANQKTISMIIIGGVAVIAWWIYRTNGDNIAEMFSERFSAYFSGTNVVSGAFNLPKDSEYRLRYFVYDFTSTFPYGTTIFGITEDTVQPFFNLYNGTYGQIPPTIGMGYYYFGPVFAPIYSVVFASTAFNAGKKLNYHLYETPMTLIRYLLVVFAFSMGIVMYNIEITMTNVFTIILPMWLMEKWR